MAPFVGELRMFAGNFAPVGWATCSGQLLPISEHEVLFNLIGTTYGGDGQTNFALPDLRGRAPVHVSPGLVEGQMGGEESVTLAVSHLPVHTHSMIGTQNVATTASPQGMVLGSISAADTFIYGNDPPYRGIDPSSISSAGGSQPHDNCQPYLCISWIIALEGIYPVPS